jgi:hypothetical protein
MSHGEGDRMVTKEQHDNFAHSNYRLHKQTRPFIFPTPTASPLAGNPLIILPPPMQPSHSSTGNQQAPGSPHNSVTRPLSPRKTSVLTDPLSAIGDKKSAALSTFAPDTHRHLPPLMPKSHSNSEAFMDVAAVAPDTQQQLPPGMPKSRTNSEASLMDIADFLAQQRLPVAAKLPTPDGKSFAEVNTHSLL